MFKIKGSTIHCSRGDSGTITLKTPITDVNDYVKYVDASENVYWYDAKKEIIYDADYKASNISLNTLRAVYYEFQEGDKITFNVYNRNGYGTTPLVSKEIIISEATESIDIPLTEEETTFGKAINKPTTYWYDVTLNDYLTIICYDEEGAKEFIVYPAKGDDE